MRLHSTILGLLLCPIAINCVNFVTIGDWGKVNEDQAKVATQLGKYAQYYNASFLLALGDNFYENGVDGTDDPQWKSTYEDVYTSTSLDIPWYAILGNHDYHQLQSPQAEVDFSKEHLDSRWTMPDFQYTINKTLEDGTTLEMIFIDTVALCPFSSMEFWKSKMEAGVMPREAFEHYAANQDQLAAVAESMWSWVTEQISQSTADWLFVAGHYPVYSGGEHGDTQCLLDQLLPLLEKYNVDAYLNGHDHTMQHLESNGVNYFVSGNAAKRGDVHSIPQTKFAVVDPGFTLHELTAQEMRVTFVDENGNQIYKTTLQRKRNL